MYVYLFKMWTVWQKPIGLIKLIFFNKMSVFSIDNTSIRNNEYIAGNDNAKQTKGTIAQIRFPQGNFFPTYAPYFVQNDIRIRDLFNWGFFEKLS